ncbi:hypothetical protein BDN72DRAFT_633072 [Pluteus cervinus]|uniref:Uncharacterized protein n=1 Tax=Pluteus cervinus TaxID=181527 RepID=A0ACD3BAD5_9AGAR|nr:hypothetical protein BDN72DRAFT_633072 [Pluteus cervinus]
MEYFSPERALLNAKFEGYKLDLISQEDAVARYALEYQPTQATVSGKAPLSFEEVQSRISHNHLSVLPEHGVAIYVDKNLRVILADLNESRPTFRVIFDIPRSIQTTENSSSHQEYPSALLLSPALAVASDGQGLLYLLRLAEPGRPADTIGTYRLPDDAPFRLHNVFNTTTGSAVAVLSSRASEPPQPIAQTSATPKRKIVKFNIWAAQLSTGLRPEIGVLDILWQRTGEDVPFYTSYFPPSDSYVVLGGSIYNEVDESLPKPYEPTPDEIAPIPRLDENLDTKAGAVASPPPYSWTQTSDSVTIAFPLPSSTPKSHMKVTFAATALTLHVDTPIDSSAPIPKYTSKKLWDGISPSTSYWTWDREAEHTFGLLTLHLDKQHEGTKWMQVFAASATSVQGDTQTSPEDVEVPETVDASELWKIRETLEKYTAALRDGKDPSGLGLGSGVPSLAEGEMDEEVDGSVGRSAFVTWVDGKGATPSWSKENATIPIQVLSTPFPGTPPSEISLIAKNNVDGVVFSLTQPNPNSSIPDALTWMHTSTYSALSFVLASKRDTRFTYHTQRGVFAFENGSQNRGGNVYIYRPAPISEKWAKQSILKVADGQGGSLLGIGVVSVKGAPLVVCLTETELVLIQGL